MLKKRIAASMLSLSVLMGSLSLGALRVYAADKEMSYTFSELEKVSEFGVSSAVSDDGSLAIKFEGQYQSQFYAIPEEISPKSIKKLVFNVTSDNSDELAYKLHTQADYDSGNKGGTPVSYGFPTVEATGEEVLYFSLMSLNGGTTEASLSGVTFYVGDGSAGGAEKDDTPSEFDIYPDISGFDESVPDLKNRFISDFGSDVITGVSITGHELSDLDLMRLVTKHFNAVTLGNELKPDCLFGYSNAYCPNTETAELNGESIEVPVLDYSRAERILDYIYDWNHYNPDQKIKIRGHVLVWHSQTPEWFFHENYDKTEPYVTPEVMNKRLEWYIKTVLEHFTGSNSKYKGMFYGWDVVNEAVSDSKGTYRSDTEGGADKLTDDTHGSKSSWWAVYKSNEFIINAFRFANKYAPADVELYYNDYNDSMPSKVKPIVELLKAVKEADGTRIDGMGMQAHYMLESPSVDQFIEAARKYAEVVGSVQLTEFDVRASSRYDGTEASTRDEYIRQAYRYRDIYNAMKQLNSEGVKVRGLTIWGAVDKYSWLQGNSSVGGGADGTQKQCPLFFDDHYHAKPCFWAIVEPATLVPLTKRVNAAYSDADNFGDSKESKFKSGDTEVSFVPIWNGSTFKVQVTVKDGTDNGDSDSVTLYLDKNNGKSAVSPEKITVSRSGGTAVDGGYQAVLEADISGAMTVVGFDIVVSDGENKFVFNDTTLAQESSSEHYAEAFLKKTMLIAKGTAKADGTQEKIWEGVEPVELGIVSGAKAKAAAKLLWDEENLYVLVSVTDAEVSDADCVDIFIDENNSKALSYGPATKHYRISSKNALSFNGANCSEGTITSAATATDNGYIVEAAIKWTEKTPEPDTNIGIELRVCDADASGARIGTLSRHDTTDSCDDNPSCFGTAVLDENAAAGAAGAESADTMPIGLIVGIAAACVAIVVVIVVVAAKKKKG